MACIKTQMFAKLVFYRLNKLISLLMRTSSSTSSSCDKRPFKSLWWRLDISGRIPFWWRHHHHFWKLACQNHINTSYRKSIAHSNKLMTLAQALSKGKLPANFFWYDDGVPTKIFQKNGQTG